MSIFTTAIGPPLPPGNPEIGLKPTLAVSLTSGAAVSVVVEEPQAESANVATEAKDAIGKRYRRHDAIGTPYCITVDYETMETNTVTLRNRDTMEQERVNIEDLINILNNTVSLSSLLEKSAGLSE